MVGLCLLGIERIRDVALVGPNTQGGNDYADHEVGRGGLLTLAAIVAIASTFAGPHPGDGSGSLNLEAWQVINLIGAPLLALLFIAPVIDDLKEWLASDRK